MDLVLTGRLRQRLAGSDLANDLEFELLAELTTTATDRHGGFSSQGYHLNYLSHLRGAAQSQQLALPRDAQSGMPRLNHGASLLSGEGLIFQPVHLDFELTDLLIELVRQSFLLLLFADPLVSEYPRQALQKLLFPLRQQVRVNLGLAGDLAQGPLPFDYLKRKLRLEFGGVSGFVWFPSDCTFSRIFDKGYHLKPLSESMGAV